MMNLKKDCDFYDFGAMFYSKNVDNERIDIDGAVTDNESLSHYVERKCDFCDFKTIWHSEMKYHVKIVHNTGNILEENEIIVNFSMKLEEMEIEPDVETILLNYEYNNEENTALDECKVKSNIYDQVFKCPKCDFQSSNVTQFHFHFVTHSDPNFECSACRYQSAKRWNVLKHILVKFYKDQSHNDSKVIDNNEIGCFDYSEYNQYLIHIENKELNDETDHVMSINDSHSDSPNLIQGNFKCVMCGFLSPKHENVMSHIQTTHGNQDINEAETSMNNDELSFNKERSHFRCAHCNQISNWKHVIQRHCRIKHNGDIKVVIVNKFGVEKMEIEKSYSCQYCGFSYESFMEYELHMSKHSRTNNNQQDVQEKENSLNYNEFEMEVSTNSTNVTEELYYKCFVCNFRTDIVDIFVNHFKTCIGNNYPNQLATQEVVNELDSQNAYKLLNKISNDRIHDLDTKLFMDIPLVWVSRMNNFVKMYKCRFCPHVNVRKSNISDHEKMHRHREYDPTKSNEYLHRCNDCSYVCNNAGVLSNHLKVHRGFFGVILRLYDNSKTDQEQINELLTEQNFLTVNF